MVTCSQATDRVFAMLDALMYWGKGRQSIIVIPKDLSLYYELLAYFCNMPLLRHIGPYCMVGNFSKITTGVVNCKIVGNIIRCIKCAK